LNSRGKLGGLGNSGYAGGDHSQCGSARSRWSGEGASRIDWQVFVWRSCADKIWAEASAVALTRGALPRNSMAVQIVRWRNWGCRQYRWCATSTQGLSDFALSIMMCFFVSASTPQRLSGGLGCSFSASVCGGGSGGSERAEAEAGVIGKSDRKIIVCVISRLSWSLLRENLLDGSLCIAPGKVLLCCHCGFGRTPSYLLQSFTTARALEHLLHSFDRQRLTIVSGTEKRFDRPSTL
jgi:hypothetical protein